MNFILKNIYSKDKYLINIEVMKHLWLKIYIKNKCGTDDQEKNRNLLS